VRYDIYIYIYIYISLGGKGLKNHVEGDSNLQVCLVR
jgi:hypothetical protein